MKVKFSYFERVAGVFVAAAIVGSFAATIGIGVKRGWFTLKIPIYATLPTAGGVYVGTRVQMSGLPAGEVDEVKLLANNEVKVKLLIREDFFQRLKSDASIQVVRPFVIGEKMVDLNAGTDGAAPLAREATVHVEASTDILDIISGKSMGAHLATLGKLAENMRKIAEAMADPKRGDQVVAMLDEIPVLLKSLQELTSQAVIITRKVNKAENLDRILGNTVVLTNELVKILPALNENSPTFGKDMALMAGNLSKMTSEFAKLVPLLEQMAPHLPKASGRALEALDETVVTLKAIQKSFLLRSAAREVREEEKKRDRDREESETRVRTPGSESDSSD